MSALLYKFRPVTSNNARSNKYGRKIHIVSFHSK